MPNNMYK